MARNRSVEGVAPRKKRPVWLWIIGGILIVGGCNALLGGPQEQAKPVQAEQATAEMPESVSFEDAVARYFSPVVTESSSFENGSGKINFKQNADYFETGDKINKIMAIESARLFRSVGDLNRLAISIPAADGTHSLDITRQQLEDHYGGPVSRFASMDAWRDQFIQANDTKEARAAFVQKFVEVQ